jgi:hypothetical protein
MVLRVPKSLYLVQRSLLKPEMPPLSQRKFFDIKFNLHFLKEIFDSGVFPLVFSKIN